MDGADKREAAPPKKEEAKGKGKGKETQEEELVRSDPLALI
jgi:hypothetical protein